MTNVCQCNSDQQHGKLQQGVHVRMVLLKDPVIKAIARPEFNPTHFASNSSKYIVQNYNLPVSGNQHQSRNFEDPHSGGPSKYL